MSILQFRCPFHKKAVEEKTLLEFTLSTNQEDRFATMHTAFTQFYAEPTTPGLAFVLSKELLHDYQSLTDLRKKTIKYYCELVATQFDVRLYPLLPYQKVSSETIRHQLVSSMRPKLLRVTEKFIEGALQEDPEILKGLKPMAAFFEKEMNEGLQRGGTNPSLKVKGLYEFSLSGSPKFLHEAESWPQNTDPRLNRNLFYFVTAPDYPESFGRYSDQVKIQFTRQAHFFALSQRKIDDIREQSNQVLRAHGVKIKNDNDLPKEGVWVPRYA